jgi:hypothetical protein
MKTNEFMLNRVVLAVFRWIHAKHMNAFCSQNAEFIKH